EAVAGVGPAGVGPAGVGVADGLFAAVLAARAALSGDGPVIVPPGETPFFLSVGFPPVGPPPVGSGPATTVVTRQVGFWGDSADTDARAGRAVAGVQELLGPEAVVRGRL